MRLGDQRYVPTAFLRERDPVPTVQKAGWATGRGWTGAENDAHAGILSLDRPAHSESLYRLSHAQYRRLLAEAKLIHKTLI